MNNRRVIVIGCGLTGPLLSMYLVRRGLAVTLYDRASDPRFVRSRMGKSLNITLAERGLHSLGKIGLRERVQRAAVPVTGRILHHLDGRLESQPYGNFGESLWSIARSDLNRLLIEAASQCRDISMHFEHSCVELDLEKQSAVFEDNRTGTRIREESAIFIGADGAHSLVRQHLQKRGEFRHSLRYANYANKELYVPKDADAPWMNHWNAIHIWPRGHHMLISFPNIDGSVTCSLHLPYEGAISYESVKTGEQVRALFANEFPDALPYIENLEESYLSHPYIRLLTLQCTPWSWDDRALLIGDAAHAILPAYGQGANCCFEDCAVLAECLDGYGGDWAAAFLEFEQRRRPNTDVIAKLSEEHFYEIRDHVIDNKFQRRKQIELRLNRANPEYYRSVYSMISFTLTPHSAALAYRKKLDSIVNYLLDCPEPEQEAVIDQLARRPEQYEEIIRA